MNLSRQDLSDRRWDRMPDYTGILLTHSVY